jgi:hypothetical protein
MPSIPLPDGSVSKIALHCSFEHFEGNSDSGFIREAARLLCPGGKLVILPLYLSSIYSILTDPLVSRGEKIDFDQGAVVAAVKGWGNRHGRFYDPRHFASRVLSASKELSFKLLVLRNPKEVDKSIYAQFVLVGTRIDAPPGTAASSAL